MYYVYHLLKYRRGYAFDFAHFDLLATKSLPLPSYQSFTAMIPHLTNRLLFSHNTKSQHRTSLKQLSSFNPLLHHDSNNFSTPSSPLSTFPSKFSKPPAEAETQASILCIWRICSRCLCRWYRHWYPQCIQGRH